MSNLLPSIGTKLELILLSSKGNDTKYTYVSQLLEIADEKTIIAASPIKSSKVVLLPIGTRMRVVFVNEKYGVFSFTATVQQRNDHAAVAYLVLSIDSEFYKIQRRSNYRLEFVSDVFYVNLNDIASGHSSGSDISGTNTDGEINIDDKLFIKALTKNISATGLCMITKQNIPLNSDLLIRLELTSDFILKQKAVVVRSERANDYVKPEYEIGLHFKSMHKSIREKLIKFIFEKQRQIISKQK